MKINKVLLSQSSRIGFSAGFAFYISYGFSFNAITNISLILISLFIGGFLPFYSRLSNYVEEKIQLKTALVTPGRLFRFLFQALFNLGIFSAFSASNVLPEEQINNWVQIISIAILTSLNSQGFQYLALAFANREKGNKNLNISIALLFNIILTCAAVAGYPMMKSIFIFLSIGLGGLVFMIGALSDVRSYIYPSGGIGVFFGTFNPMHRTHIKLIRDLMLKRNVERVYIHPTVIPKLHRDALNKNEIKITKYEDGMRVYAQTEKADPHVNYFPTGSRFLEYQTRLVFLKLQLQEAQLDDRVEVLNMPENYEVAGFYGVLSEIKKRNPGKVIHGIHGSDLGGMWIRSIYDECGWIYPFNIIRSDAVSATAIRNGAKGLMTTTAEKVFDSIKSGHSKFIIGRNQFSFTNGVLEHENI